MSAQSSEPAQSRGLWRVVWCVGWGLVALLIVLTVVLLLRVLPSGIHSLTLVRAAMAGESRAVSPAPNPSASDANGPAKALDSSKSLLLPAPESKSGNEGDKDALANAMTAIGTAVAVVTLVLALVVPKLSDDIKRLENVEKNYKSETDKLQQVQKELEDSMKERRRLTHLWLAAQRAALKWAYSGTNVPLASAPATTQEMGLYLQALQSDDEQTRREAFGFFVTRSWSPELMPSDQTQPLLDYQNACHRYHAMRKGVAEQDAMNQRRVWCLFWDKAEQALFDEPYPPKTSSTP